MLFALVHLWKPVLYWHLYAAGGKFILGRVCVCYLEHEMQFSDPAGLYLCFAFSDPTISLDHN